MSIVTTEQKILVAGVEDIIVTDPVLDEGAGVWVREIRIVTDAAAGAAPSFTLRVSAADRDKINVSAPPQEF